ncbi:hypothetical protein MT325_m555L [Paramecium bursaria chlorella virus MT325]|uniref:Uncharacterized protein m555L n=1 Tax=Paramecium bursaria Chlorella virus MT325 TaxID=346932 RepID=A7IUT5_PBCVM|nr:hypothetical protein MT325_m555L [Paramecium bursaria chlorella virus MT325]
MSPLSTVASVRTYEEVSPVILLANMPMKNSTRPKMPEITLPVTIRMLQYLAMLSIVHYAHISFFVDIFTSCIFWYSRQSSSSFSASVLSSFSSEKQSTP